MDEEKTIDKDSPTPPVSRRKLLRFITAFLGLFGLGAVLSSIVAFLTPPRSALKKVGGWQVVGSLSEFKENLSLSKVYFGLPLLLMKEETGIRVFLRSVHIWAVLLNGMRRRRPFSVPVMMRYLIRMGKCLKAP